MKLHVRMYRDFVEIPLCSCYDDAVRDNLRKLAYGVYVDRYGKSLLFVPTEKSGLTDRGKKLLANLGGIVEHNQIYMLVLAVVAAIAVLCAVEPNNKMCSELQSGLAALEAIAVLGAALWIGLHLKR